MAGLVLGAAVMVVGTMTWVQATTSSAVQTTIALAVPGSVVAPAVNAGGLVVLAASCALALAGRWGRRFAAGGVVVGGLLAAVSGVAGLADPHAAALSAARETVGVGVLDGPVTTTPMPVAAVVLGLLVAALGVRTAWVTGRWTAPSARHEVAPDAVPDRVAVEDAVPDGVVQGDGVTGEGVTADGVTGEAPPAGPVDPYDTWDALSRGHDPT